MSAAIPALITLMSITFGVIAYEDRNTDANRRRMNALLCFNLFMWAAYLVLKAFWQI